MATDPALERRALIAGRYEQREPIGRGGMGEVHAAWDRRLERPVAIKTLRADVAAQPDARRRFESEARSAARLVHPNVVSVYDSGEDAGIPFMVMELLPGRSLRDELAGGPMALREVQSLAAQVLGALGAAHAAGIVHRDIKPGNILMTEDGRWKVGDFGIAKSVQMEGGDETATGMVLGTPAYLPPERLFGSEATPGGDLYSLGVILYQALAGRRPFEADTPEGWAAVIAARSAEPLANVRADVPPAMADAIGRSISPDPTTRFSSAEEMAAAMGLGVVGTSRMGAAGAAGAVGAAVAAPLSWREIAPAAPPGESTAVLAEASPAATSAFAAPAPAHRRRRAAALLAGGGALAAIVGISLAASSGSPSPANVTHPTTTTTVTTLPTTVPTTVPPPPPPAHHDHGGGGGKGGGDGG